jgi:hypothetical protein
VDAGSTSPSDCTIEAKLPRGDSPSLQTFICSQKSRVAGHDSGMCGVPSAARERSP